LKDEDDDDDKVGPVPKHHAMKARR